MATAYAMQTRDIIRIVTAETLSQVNAIEGGNWRQLQTACAHGGDGNPPILAAYLLHIHEAHFRSTRVCR